MTEIGTDAGIAIVPRTRTQLIDRLNHTLVPYAAASYAIGSPYPLGAAPFPDANAVSIPFSTATPLIGGNTGQLILKGAGTSRGALLLNQSLSTLQMGVNTTYTASLWVNSPTGGPNPQLLVNGPGVVGTNYSAAASTKNAWTRISVTFTTSGTADILSCYLFFDSAGFTNAYCLFDALQIDDGAAAQPWFSGDGPLQANPNSLFKWTGTRYQSVSAMYHFDPSEVKYPLMIENGYHYGKDNGNLLYRTLSNALYVARRPASQSIGTLRATFTSRQGAFELYSLLDRLDDFQLIDNNNPESGMFFSVDGRVLIDQDPERVVPDTGQNLWSVTVPFQQTA